MWRSVVADGWVGWRRRDWRTVERDGFLDTQQLRWPTACRSEERWPMTANWRRTR